MKNGVSTAMTAASIGSFVISWMLSDSQCFDIQQKTDSLYALKKALTDHLYTQLTSYSQSPSHEKAVGIIAGLNILRQAKLTGEEMISLFNLASYYKGLDLEKAPAARAALWNEMRYNDPYSYTTSGVNGYITKIWAVYESSLKEEETRHYESAGYSVTYYEKLSTPVGYYRMDKEAAFLGRSLSALPANLQSAGSDVKHKLPGRALYTGHRMLPLDTEAWRSGELSGDTDLSNVYKEEAYLYQRGDLDGEGLSDARLYRIAGEAGLNGYQSGKEGFFPCPEFAKSTWRVLQGAAWCCWYAPACACMRPDSLACWRDGAFSTAFLCCICCGASG